MSITEHVISAFADRASVQVSEINDETMIKDLGIDSMSYMDLVMSLEQDRRLVFSDDEYSIIIEAITVGQVVEVFASAKVALRAPT